MDKEEVVSVAQLLTSMKDTAEKLERALNMGNVTEVDEAKKEIMKLKNELDRIL